MNSSPAESQELIQSVLETLDQGEALLTQLSNQDYTRQVPVAFNASIGGHYRHCLDHFRSLLDSATDGDLNYDHRERGTSIGSIATRMVGPRREGMPSYVGVPYAMSIGIRPGYFGANYLGLEHNPFETEGDPNAAAFAVNNINLASGLSIDRLEDRRGLQKQIDQLHRTVDASGTLDAIDRFDEAAYELVAGSRARKAFDIGCEDPRVVKVDDHFYLTYTAYDGETARLALATSKDLRVWEKRGLLFPDRGWTKSGAILAAPIGGKYWMYLGDSNIWAAHSPNLLDWTVVEEPLLRPRPGRFDSHLAEPGPPPILTADGILLLYNGADDGLRYTAGQVLFDKQDPARAISRSETPYLTPSVELEYTGQVPNVVFVEGLVSFKNRWFLYYGMGDSGIGVAVCET